MTREHVIAAWVGELFTVPIVGHSEILRGDALIHRFPSRPLEQDVRTVCGQCNNGWMSDLEDRVKPILGPMLKDWKRTRLTQSKQRLLASWAMKTAFMFDQVHRSDQTVPPTEYHRFYKLKQPPQAYVVLIGWRNNIMNHNGTAIEMVQSRQETISNISCPDEISRLALEKEFESGARAYRITFGIGHVIFQVFGSNLTGKITVTNVSNVEIAHVIWPVQKRVAWPPPHPIDVIGGFLAFHDAFNPEN